MILVKRMIKLLMKGLVEVRVMENLKMHQLKSLQEEDKEEDLQNHQTWISIQDKRLCHLRKLHQEEEVDHLRPIIN